MGRCPVPSGVRKVLFVANTRIALGVGIGLLIADRFNRRDRRRAGWKLGRVFPALLYPFAA